MDVYIAPKGTDPGDSEAWQKLHVRDIALTVAEDESLAAESTVPRRPRPMHFVFHHQYLLPDDASGASFAVDRSGIAELRRLEAYLLGIPAGDLAPASPRSAITHHANRATQPALPSADDASRTDRRRRMFDWIPFPRRRS